MVWKVGFKPTTFGQCCYRWVFYLDILWFPISSAYIFIIMMFGTLGRIIFIHLLRSTVVECLFAIIQLTSVLTFYSLHRFYRILLGQFTQNRRAIRLHHFQVIEIKERERESSDWDPRRNGLLGTFPDYYRAILISHLSFYDFISGSPCSRSQPISLYLGRGFSHTTVNKHRFRSNC